MVASAVLTAALALVALPGIAGSRSPSSASVVDPAAFHHLETTANTVGRETAIRPLDDAHGSAGRIDALTAFALPGEAPVLEVGRPSVRQPAARSGSALKPPLYTLTGIATFYHQGTTAMRLPRGTIVIICGAGGCIERSITDYGPAAGSDRVADLHVADFFEICGCPAWAGETTVTVSVY
jgi:hypothetical protein